MVTSIAGGLWIASVLDAPGDFFGVNLGFILPLPIIANEIFLGIWLIVKGFRPAAAAARA
jgi:hypothetical protein